MKFNITKFTKNGKTMIPWVPAIAVRGLKDYIRQVVQEMKSKGEI